MPNPDFADRVTRARGGEHAGRRTISIAPYWKAVLGFLTPGAVIIGSAVLDGSDGGSAITTAEWVTALVAMVVTGGAVYRKSNEPTP